MDTKSFRWVIRCPAIKFEWRSTGEHNIRRGIIPSASIIKNSYQKAAPASLPPPPVTLLSETEIKKTQKYVTLFMAVFLFLVGSLCGWSFGDGRQFCFLIFVWFIITNLKDRYNGFLSNSTSPSLASCSQIFFFFKSRKKSKSTYLYLESRRYILGFSSLVCVCYVFTFINEQWLSSRCGILFLTMSA